MADHIIKNFDSLASTPARKLALQIAESGLQAINTSFVIKQNITLNENILTIENQTYDLNLFKRIFIIGFGKASGDALIALNQILGNKITTGIAIDVKTIDLPNPNLHIYKGTHPKASVDNVTATQKIIKLAKDITKFDLVIVIVSGGGSALMVGSETELNDSSVIFDEFLSTGGDIVELNTLRKHVSVLKGGGLAKLFYPSTIIGLIFSDVPGGQIEDVASGPTYPDTSTIEDVNQIISKYHLEKLKSINFTDTVSDQKYFQKVQNILLVSNKHALTAMSKKAVELGFNPKIITEKLMIKSFEAAEIMTKDLSEKEVRLSGGEVGIVPYIENKFGKGGRNLQTTLESMQFLKPNEVFISLATDGMDNSDAGGAIADSDSKAKIPNYETYKQNLDSYPALEKMGDIIYTGPTGSNVADLIITLKL